MASYLDKFKIKTAAPKKEKFDLSCQHVTTADFMQLAPIYVKEMVPGESLNVVSETFSRMAALQVPTFGRCSIHNRAFFVPFRTIFPGWNDFITDTQHVNAALGTSLQSMVPTVTQLALQDALFTTGSTSSGGLNFGPFGSIYGNATPEYLDAHLSEFDFAFKNPTLTGATYYRMIKLNEQGRQFVKILNSLGYQFIANGADNDTYSALPILAFMKVYCDWYWPSAYYDQAERTEIEGYFNIDNYTTAVSLTPVTLYKMFIRAIRVNYDSDYFVSAFESPVGPVSRAFSDNIGFDDFTVPDSSTNNLSVATYSNGTPAITSRVGSTTATRFADVSQFAIDALKALTDYMKRHQLAGARALDRYMSRFGINLKSEKLDRSVYIGSQTIPLQIGDVMSQASTEGAQLGDYAGKGLAYGGNQFDYETDEFGLFIICSSIVPAIGYYQGVDRNCYHVSRTDYYTPEFDQLGNQALFAKELYVNSTNPTSDVNLRISGATFGFAPRYAEYKVGRDRLTGDYRINRLNTAGDTNNSWHLMREFDDDTWSLDGDNVKISSSFVRGTDAEQFDRIFAYTGDNDGYTNINSTDHFYMIHNFNVASYAPMKRLYDTYEFDSEGKEMVLDVNGVKVN